MSSQQPNPVIRIALVDNQTIFLEGLRALVDREADLEVVAQASHLGAAERLDVDVHVVVSDLALVDATRDEVVPRLRARFGSAAIIVLTEIDSLATVQAVLAAGADGYVLKSADKADLFAGIRAVAGGSLYLQPSIGIAFASRTADDLARPAVNGLTPKETEVLRLLALGHTNAEIGHLVGASLRTIETHRAHIHQKLDRHTRAELVRFALDARLLRIDDDGGPMVDRRIVNGQRFVGG